MLAVKGKQAITFTENSERNNLSFFKKRSLFTEVKCAAEVDGDKTNNGN